MKSIAIVLTGAALCGVGAYGFVHNLDLWGAWVIVGGLIVYSQVD
ncbi:putative membrane protein [Erwinia phage pEa_SNUABM_50]|uniref:Putative membrane protein n=2 Tax=Eneladusvirus BF TaxID=2560751 RepID=A0A7L8ZN01_9CAUD|nr:putative membrane protein [Erwinia phage pEa_SNUABM_47]QOI72196.1 putative membrane protein [Erwinia phage pEa_SNUABM_50]QXO11322.1 hypothetical protein pEaSNUABM19_00176 [Erwinia phage pEa_SNUABM_19]QXO11870.1 hypothetical protein pEaSNUABM44_00174 [Erwinia phage pEa_SNUABM_44]QXO12422.1 hypothetical protein pEaSNUABM49_00176 [Erwinia phage pEa_SNUABM_49]